MKLRFLITTVFVVGTFLIYAGNAGKGDKKPAAYVFEDEILLPATSVKDQYRTGTCWSFS